MLERAASCLNSSTRRISRATSRCIFRSRRQLHSSFWHHGASDLELPSWWSVIEPLAAIVGRRDARRDGNGGGRDVGMLEFLYPPKTMAFMKKISMRHSQHARTDRATQATRSRQFSSKADEFVAAVLAAQANARPGLSKEKQYGIAESESLSTALPEHMFTSLMDEQPQEKYVVLKPLEQLKRTLAARVPAWSESEDYESVWQLHLQIQPEDRSQRLIVSIVNFLSFSTRQIDEVRTLFFLATNLTPDQRSTDMFFWSAIISQLRRGSLEAAVTTHEQAVQASAQGYVGTNILLAHLFRRKEWDLALRVYTVKMATIEMADKEWLRDDRTNVWDMVEQLPALTEAAIIFLVHARENLDCTYAIIRSFIDQLCLKAALLGIQAGSSRQVWRLVQAMQSMNIDTRNLCELLIPVAAASMIPAQKYTAGSGAKYKLLVDLYMHYRTLSGVHPPVGMVNQVAETLLVHRSPRSDWEANLSEVLSDYQNQLGLPIPTRIICLRMRKYAESGNVGRVQELFEKLSPSFGGAIGPDVAHALLLVHAMRGEPAETLSQLDKLRVEFVWEPDTTTRNIVLKAYSCADEIENCFKVFNQMVDNGDEINQESVMPLLELCANRGNATATVEVLEMAKSRGVSIDTGMFQMLLLAHAQNNNLTAAEEAADALTQAWKQGQFKDDITAAWNIVILAVGKQGDSQNANRIFRKIQELGVEPDTMTYHGIITALAFDQQADVALMMLTKVLPNKELPIFPEHYVAIMRGYYGQGHWDKALAVYDVMLRDGIAPNAEAKIEYLKAKLQIELKPDVSTINNDKLESEVRMIVKFVDESCVESIDASLESVFEALISTYARIEHYEMVQKWVKLYEEQRGTIDSTTPSKVLYALMKAFLKAGRYDYVQRYWSICLQHAERFARTPDFVIPVPRSNVDATASAGKFAEQAIDTSSHKVAAVPRDNSLPKSSAGSDTVDSRHSLSDYSIPEKSPHGTSLNISLDSWDISPAGFQDFSPDLSASSIPSPDAINDSPVRNLKNRSILPHVDPEIHDLLPSRQDSISTPLTLYLRSLADEGFDDYRFIIHNTVMGLLSNGWKLNNAAWNEFVRCLISQSRIPDTSEQSPRKAAGESLVSQSRIPGMNEEYTRKVTEETFGSEDEDALAALENRLPKRPRKSIKRENMSFGYTVPSERPKLDFSPVGTIPNTNPPPFYILKAFRICEEMLMPGFPGWIARPRPLTTAQKNGRWSGGFYWMQSSGQTSLPLSSNPCPQLETLLDLRDSLSHINSLYMLSASDNYSQFTREDWKTINTGSFSRDSDIPDGLLFATIKKNAPYTLAAINSIPQIGVRASENPGEFADRMGTRYLEAKNPIELKGWMGSRNKAERDRWFRTSRKTGLDGQGYKASG